MAADMMGRSHFVTGVTAGALGVTAGVALDAFLPIWPTTDLLARPMFIALVAYFALAPDLDHPHSTVTYSIGPVTIFLSWVLRGGPVDVCFWRWDWNVRLLPWHVEHRGVTHDVRFGPAGFALVLGPPTWFLPGWFGQNWWLWTWGIFLGCVTHIWGDARTVSGVPLGTERIWIGTPFVTGSDEEHSRREWYYQPAAIGSCFLAFVATLYPALT